MKENTSPQLFVVYYRVSTARQGSSGLGLEAQKAAVTQFIYGRGAIVEDYTDVESGKKNSRPQLLQAIEACKIYGAVLLIAKLDRLSRNAGFIFTLRDSGVQFVCADMPEANTLTIGVLATMAQHERELISERTRNALEELKKRGVKLGKPENLSYEAQSRGAKTVYDNARNDLNNRRAGAFAVMLHQSGGSLQDIADTLNANGFVTRRGRRFQKEQVRRLILRAKEVSNMA